jgi:CubicO group peptidase (beta-lactamase class C family)
MHGPLAFPGLALLGLLGLLVLTPLHAEPDESHLGKPLGYPIGNAATWYSNPHRVGSWSALHSVPGIQTRQVARAENPAALPKAAQPPAITYLYRNVAYTLADYLDRQRVTGLLVLKNGEIVAEHYRYGRSEDARFLSFSMAKSVTSMLVGMALARGHLASLDDEAQKYVPARA